MQIETYEIEEVKGEMGIMAADSEAIELIEKLGLQGQKDLADNKTDTRFPYPRITELEQLVYGTIFPQKTKVENFKSGIIPLRVLQVVAHVREFEFIKRVEVWHPTDARLKDPLLVAVEGDNEYSWRDGPTYILSRWGDALLTFEELRAMAQRTWTAATKAQLAAIRSKLDMEIANLDSIAEAAFLTGKVREYSLNGIE